MPTTSFTDAFGQQHTAVDAAAAVKAPPRIVCLVPSLTELLCDLGLAHWLVGRTGFCIHPADTVRAIPKVGGTKDVNVEKIRKLAPTHLIVNIDENEKATVEALAQSIPHVIVTHPITPEDNMGLYRLLGGIFGVGEKAEALCAAFEEELVALVVLPWEPERTVLYCIWQDPWMTISSNTYIANMLALIGWRAWEPVTPAGQTVVRYPQFTWSDPSLREIDSVLLSSEPYHFTGEHADMLEKQIGKPVQLVDGEMMSWYGSRAIAGLRYLRQLVQEG
jgi:ABC-type Fe3+-hydroxamate transport system substrate-binding protein